MLDGLLSWIAIGLETTCFLKIGSETDSEQKLNNRKALQVSMWVLGIRSLASFFMAQFLQWKIFMHLTLLQVGSAVFRQAINNKTWAARYGSGDQTWCDASSSFDLLLAGVNVVRLYDLL